MANLLDTREKSLTGAELPTIAKEIHEINRGVGELVAGMAVASVRTRTGGVRHTGSVFLPCYHNTYYNLFVLDDTAYEQGSFYIAGRYALTKAVNVEPHVIKHFGDLFDNPQTYGEIKTLPSLFMNVNTKHKCADDSQTAWYGTVDKIISEKTRIKILWSKIKEFQQQTLNECADELGISSSFAKNELDSPRWSIKELDLVPALERIGVTIDYPEPQEAVVNEGVLV